VIAVEPTVIVDDCVYVQYVALKDVPSRTYTLKPWTKSVELEQSDARDIVEAEPTNV
jgi:hypothetical protein